MPNSTSEFIAIFFAILLLFLIMALIFRPKFREAVLGGSGEATIMGVLTVKGVVIVLLSALFVGGILLSLNKESVEEQSAEQIPVRLNVHFDPNDVNPRSPDFNVRAYIKTSKGTKPIPSVEKMGIGGLSVSLEVPDMNTPFFIVFDAKNGTWQTDDFSIYETTATARKQGEVIYP